jgi:cell division protein FtsQ
VAKDPDKTPRWRLALSAAVWMGAVSCVFLAARRVQAYACGDPQFTLEPPRVGGPPGMTVDGARYASKSKILRVFEADFGRSVFLMPLPERRRRLLAVDWVEDAAISRIWPNRVWVRIRERRPVAFVNVQLGRRGGYRVLLIDAHGVLLEQPPQARFQFPVLRGVSAEQEERERRHRVEAMLELLRDLGPGAAQVSEVDVSAPDNLGVVAQVDGVTVDLMLGDTNFGRRFQSFVTHFAEIRKRSPQATSFDLRLDAQITAKE